MKKFKLLIFIILGIHSFSLNAEVQSVVMRWTPGRCKEGCEERLQTAFAKSKAVESIVINDTTGSASLTWNPQERFSYRTLKNPMQRVGIGIDSISVVVRGEIKKVGNSVILTSEGDGTKFNLVSYDPRKPGGRYLSLDPKLEEILLNKENKDRIFVVEGPLYQAHRSPPFYLVVTRVQAEK